MLLRLRYKFGSLANTGISSMRISRIGQMFYALLVLIGASTAPCLAAPPGATEADPKLAEELRATLSQFATKHSLNDQQLSRTLDMVRLGSQGLNEGGVGPVGRGTFVLLDKGPNQLRFSLNKNGRPTHRAQWLGAAQSKPQLVITDGKRVVWASNTDDLSNWTVVLFTPTRVHYVDVSTWLGGEIGRQQ